MEEEVRLGSFNYQYIKALTHFEQLVGQVDMLAFRPEMLLPPNSTPITMELQQLKSGLNTDAALTVTIIRVIQTQQCTLALSTTTRPFTLASLFILLIPHQHLPSQKEIELRSRTVATITSPYMVQEEGQVLPTLVVKEERVIIVSKSDGRGRRSVQDLREQANNYFKAGRFLDAINLYEKALASLYKPNPRQQAVLYSNAAACLFELRLFQSCVSLSDLAIRADPSYSKGYYRKIRSLLQLHRFGEVTPLLLGISQLISKQDIQLLNQKYTELIAQESGVFCWEGLIKGACAQGQYFNEKVKSVRYGGEGRLAAREGIHQWEPILVVRPLIYVAESGQNFKDSFMQFLKEIQSYSQLDQGFQACVQLLPCQCHPLLAQREHAYQVDKQQPQPLSLKELFNKLQRSVFQEKALDKPANMNGYGIWKEMFNFDHSCLPNCTAVHLNGYWIVSALTPISEGESLTLDLIAQGGPARRRESMRIKLGRECGCEMCEGQVQVGPFSTIQELYDQIEVMESSRRKKQYIWGVVERQWNQRFSLLQEDSLQLIYYYIFYVEKQCEWDDVLNLIQLRHKYPQKEFYANIDDLVIKTLSNYLRIMEKESKKIYELILAKTSPPKVWPYEAQICKI